MPYTTSIPQLTDTLAADTAKITQWREMGDFDYSRDFNYKGQNFLDWLGNLLNDAMNELFNDVSTDETYTFVKIACVVVFVVLLVWIWMKVKPQVFAKESSDDSYDIEEDNIYGVDFDARIAEAMSRKNYRETVRLLHLQTLKWLTDNNAIDWQPYKTPTQYTHEHADPAFRQMTNTFLYVRYGNGKADEVMAENMRSLQKRVMDKLQETNKPQEGGEQ